MSPALASPNVATGLARADHELELDVLGREMESAVRDGGPILDTQARSKVLLTTPTWAATTVAEIQT